VNANQVVAYKRQWRQREEQARRHSARVETRSAIEAAQRQAKWLADILVEQFDVSAVYLFGSAAWGEGFGPHSDIDLAVSGLEPASFFKAWAVLPDSPRSVELVDLDDVPVFLKQRIMTRGICLYDRQRAVERPDSGSQRRA